MAMDQWVNGFFGGEASKRVGLSVGGQSGTFFRNSFGRVLRFSGTRFKTIWATVRTVLGRVSKFLGLCVAILRTCFETPRNAFRDSLLRFLRFLGALFESPWDVF